MNRHRTGTQLLAGAIALASLTTACGLKPDATASLKTGSGATVAANGDVNGVPGTGGGNVPGAVTPGGSANPPGGVAAGAAGGVVPGGSSNGGAAGNGNGTGN